MRRDHDRLKKWADKNAKKFNIGKQSSAPEEEEPHASTHAGGKTALQRGTWGSWWTPT